MIAKAPSEDLVLAYPPVLGVAAHIRSTLLTSSLQALRQNGLAEKHSALLDPEHRETILSCVAGQWLPLAAGVAHYQACQGLGLTTSEQADLGRRVSRNIHETLLGVTVKMARGVGLTPWTLLAKGNTLYARLFRGGGGTQITRVASNGARIEIAGLPLLDIPYFRNAVAATYAAGIELLASNALVRVRPSESSKFGVRTVLYAEWS